MIGALVPAVVLPRFTSYVGAGTYATAPMDVTAYLGGNLTFWRGPLVGGAATNPFRAYFEESHDAINWRTVDIQPDPFPIILVNRYDEYAVPLLKRWFRVRVELAGDANGVVGITLWLVGGLEARED